MSIYSLKLFLNCSQTCCKVKYFSGKTARILQPEKGEVIPITKKKQQVKQVGTSASKKLVCYYPSWSAGFKGLGQVHPEDINATLCTHIIYAFSTVGLNNTIQPIQYYKEFDITQGTVKVCL